MKAPDKIYVEVCEDGIFAFPEPPFKESVEYIRADLIEQPLQQEPLGSPLCGVVYNDSEHLAGLIVDSAQLYDRLKVFPDGAKVDIFIIAKEDK